MRNRRAKLLRIGRVHLHVAGRMDSSGQGAARRDDVGADPVKVSGILAGRQALLVGHLGIDFPRAMVFEAARKDIVDSSRFCSGQEIDKRLKPQPMSQLMENHAHEVQRSGGRIAVETIVPHQRERAGRADAAVEDRADVARPRTEIAAGEAIRQGLGIPGIGQRRADEVAMGGFRAGGSEGRGTGAAG